MSTKNGLKSEVPNGTRDGAEHDDSLEAQGSEVKELVNAEVARLHLQLEEESHGRHPTPLADYVEEIARDRARRERDARYGNGHSLSAPAFRETHRG